ncbi:hypothetical protein HMPREF1022_03284 [Desulfovibrio sp. 6_1_46AFAA]|uniref:hypothetical protein n=1 Tax=Desulfovibrio sp. 6_1_46AFAA TaxID=665942 RepID=UPI000223733F|nr:hypothetical protein [Desulfovibrio sp. 6_1_46AFAA]EGW49767.1 hypothetical protein HMPREF1022_03284 [Desulfovibrio sp. 6_1_46AFAA]
MNSTVLSGIRPTTELEAVNIILSGIGEAPISSFAEVTADVSLARNILAEISRETQTEGWQWNTEDDFPLTPDAAKGEIKLPPTAIRVHFREPDDRELTIRGQRVYDRVNHSFIFSPGVRILVTLTLLLPFEDLPEAARRYITLKAARVFQERTVGSGTLYDFQQADEARARALMLADERRQDRPNILKGTLPPTGTWRPWLTLLHRNRRLI